MQSPFDKVPCESLKNSLPVEPLQASTNVRMSPLLPPLSIEEYNKAPRSLMSQRRGTVSAFVRDVDPVNNLYGLLGRPLFPIPILDLIVTQIQIPMIDPGAMKMPGHLRHFLNQLPLKRHATPPLEPPICKKKASSSTCSFNSLHQNEGLSSCRIPSPGPIPHQFSRRNAHLVEPPDRIPLVTGIDHRPLACEEIL